MPFFLHSDSRVGRSGEFAIRTLAVLLQTTRLATFGPQPQWLAAAPVVSRTPVVSPPPVVSPLPIPGGRFAAWEAGPATLQVAIITIEQFSRFTAAPATIVTQAAGNDY